MPGKLTYILEEINCADGLGTYVAKAHCHDAVNSMMVKAAKKRYLQQPPAPSSSRSIEAHAEPVSGWSY